MAEIVVFEQRRDGFHPLFYRAAVSIMDHGKQVIGPVGQLSGAVVTVADETECPHLLPADGNALIGDIPNRHTVGSVTEGVVIRHRTDAADDTERQQAPDPRHHLLRGQSHLFGYRLIGLRHQRQSCLGSSYDGTVVLINDPLHL